MKLQEFKSFLDLYGTDINRWPGEFKEMAKLSLKSSIELQNLLEEEKQFEAALNLRSFEEPSSDLEYRIIAAAKRVDPQISNSKSVFNFIKDLFNSFNLPNPAYALSMILIIGITLGFFINNSNNVSASQDLLAGEINFYDGEFYE
ncbi:MAG: hypothetical protein ACRENO_04295 [Thermodesulfobacteriota bacterium]